MAKKLVTVGLAAEILGVSREVLRYWDKSGRLKATRNQNNNYRFYDITKLQQFAKKHGLGIGHKIKLIKD